MQFHVAHPNNLQPRSFLVKSSCAENCSIALHVTASEHVLGHVVNASEASLEFRPYDDASSLRLHYVTLRLESGFASNVTVSLEGLADDEEEEEGLAEMKLTRKSLPDFFLFDYEHLVGNGSKPAPMNLTDEEIGVMRFKVGAVYDTGGTLSVGLKLADEEKDRKEKVVIVGCLSLGMAFCSCLSVNEDNLLVAIF